MPRSFMTKPTSLRVSALGLLPGERRLADEALALDHPAEAGLERRVLLVDVVAVEGEARLEAQGVARAEADRLEARAAAAVEERVPQARRRSAACDEQLEAVLAGVAGARHVDVDARRSSRRRKVNGASSATGDRRSDCDQRDGARPLHREQRDAVGRVVDVADRARLLVEPARRPCRCWRR